MGRSGGGQEARGGEAPTYFSVAIHRDVTQLDSSVAASGDAGLFGNNDGYIVALLVVANAGLGTFKFSLRERRVLHLQEDKTELYSPRMLDEAELGGMKRAGVETEAGWALFVMASP